jgi:hypothetical protein
MKMSERHFVPRLLIASVVGFAVAFAELLVWSMIKPEEDVSSFLAPRGYWGLIAIAIFIADRVYVKLRMRKSKLAQGHL